MITLGYLTVVSYTVHKSQINIPGHVSKLKCRKKDWILQHTYHSTNVEWGEHGIKFKISFEKLIIFIPLIVPFQQFSPPLIFSFQWMPVLFFNPYSFSKLYYKKFWAYHIFHFPHFFMSFFHHTLPLLIFYTFSTPYPHPYHANTY